MILNQCVSRGYQIRCKGCGSPLYELKRSIARGQDFKPDDDLKPIFGNLPTMPLSCPHCDSEWFNTKTGKLN